MAAMDEFKTERELVKNAPFKKKLEYFWEYYKWQTMIGILVVLFICGYIHTIVTDTENVLMGIMINTYSTEDGVTDSLKEGYYEKYDIDSSKYDVVFDNTRTYSVSGKAGVSTSNDEARSIILSKTGSGQLDFMTGDLESMTDLAYSDLFVDLREILTEEQLKEYEPYLLYIDKTIMDTILEASANYEDIGEVVIPGCSEPEKMDDPVPVLIDMSSSDKFDEIYQYDVETLVFGATDGIPHVENTVKFIEYAMEQKGDLKGAVAKVDK